MLWKLLIASFFLGSACAMHLEYLKADSADEEPNGILILDTSQNSVDQDEDLPISEAQLPGICWACKWAMKKLKKRIGNNINQDNIKEQLMTVCSSIGFLRSLCKRMISEYMDVLVEELSTTDDAKAICVNIGVCNSVGIMELIQVFLQNYQKN